jgi:hypothetical protein
MSKTESLHKRIADINMSLMGMKIEKTGYNKHKGYKYYELMDILPPVQGECYKKGIGVEFPYVEGVAILKLVDLNDEKQYIPYRIAMPELIVPEKNPNNKLIQDIGANITYLQRYLLKLAFPALSDKDLIDSDDVKDTASSAQEKTQSSDKKEDVADVNVGQLVLEAKEALNKKGLEDSEITYKALRKQILKKNWSVPERRVILNYFKEKEAS